MLACLVARAEPAQALSYVGVNLSGAEFGESQIPGSYGSSYTYPTPAEIDYYRSVGMNVVRIPFLWERLQRSLYAGLDATEFSRLSYVVGYATGHGMSV